MSMKRCLTLIAVLALGACSRQPPAATDAAAGSGTDVVLPQPDAKGGPVTGMPSHPGPGDIHAPMQVPAPGVASDTISMGDADAASQVPANGAPRSPTAPADEPTAQDALAVVQAYFSAIDARQYAQAWSMWSDGGRASQQSLQQFADGFSDTDHVAVETGAIGPVQGAAGSRYVEIPVSIDATLRDGSSKTYAGTYTLRRAVVDGATPEQRAWHIAMASMHPTQP